MKNRWLAGRAEETSLGAATALGVGDRVFLSGLTVEPEGPVEEQFREVVGLVEEALGQFKASLADVVRTRVFYTRPQDRAPLVAAHGRAFRRAQPAASLTEVHFLPAGAQVMLEVEAIRGSSSRRRVVTLDTPEAQAAACAGLVQVGDELWLAGVTALQPDGKVNSPGDVSGQSRYVVSRMLAMLEQCGATAADVVSTRHYTPVAYVGLGSHHDRIALMHPGHPTSAGITVQGVGSRDVAILIEAEAVVGASRERRNVNTGRTYEEEHHYCRAVRVGEGDVVYVAGTTSVQLGEVVGSPFDAYGQTIQTLEWIRFGIEKLGLPFSDVVRTRSYVVGQENLEPVARALRETLGRYQPAATVVGVPALGRPSILVEIEATAVRNAGQQG